MSGTKSGYILPNALKMKTDASDARTHTQAHFSPIAIKKAIIAYHFGLSGCNTAKRLHGPPMLVDKTNYQFLL